MDSLFLLQFACFIFMLVNAFFVAVSHLHVRWENKRYERSRWMIVVAMIGLAMQFLLQMAFGFRAADDSLGAIINILIYTPCFSLISLGIYNIETIRTNLRKMILMCSGIYAAIIVAFCVGISLHVALCEIFARKCNHSMARSSGYACCHLFHHLIIYSRSSRIACPNVLQPYVYRSRKQLYSNRRVIG